MDIFTDGKIKDWPCNAQFAGDKVTGYDVNVAPYTVNDVSAPDEVMSIIEACNETFKTSKQAKMHIYKLGFIPDTKWGEMG